MSAGPATPPAACGAADDPIDTEALVIGGGPVGLYQVFQLGLLDIRTHLVDALPAPGGQPLELYPDKPIFDLPGIPACTGRELTEALQRQVAPFDTPQHLDQTVIGLRRRPDGRFELDTSRGTRFLTRTVFIAAGVGAFLPKPLKLPGLAAFEGRQLFYRLPDDDGALAGRDVVVVGGADTAVDWALACAEPGPRQARRVCLVHRRDAFQASPPQLAALAARRAGGAIEVIAGQPEDLLVRDGRLAGLQLARPDGSACPVPLDTLLVAQGLSPRLGPIADWGLAMDRKQLRVDSGTCATSEPGIWAVGDINTYPGKKKLLVCGFHESTLAAYAAAAYLRPGEPVHLQYTTTSPRLHRLLGLAPAPDRG